MFDLKYCFVFVVLVVHCALAKILEVGSDKLYTTIEAALACAVPGDEIRVYPAPLSTSYRGVALRITHSNLILRAEGDVVLDGEGVDYSGRGSVPRAIVQFEPGADGCCIEGFTLLHARNSSCNAAGVRINQANNITIRRCTIRNNDMGIMSNGSVAQQCGTGQLIDECAITDNGNTADSGLNHNLYLGGVDVTIRRCEIARAVTGHNLKSRAHMTLVENCFIHDGANREIDIVDEAGNTDIFGSDARLQGNVIIKRKTCVGNRGVIHFGKDGKATRHGTLYLEGNAIETPFVTPVVIMSAGERVVLTKNSVRDGHANQRGVLVFLRDGAIQVNCSDNRIPERFVLQGTAEQQDD